MAGDHERLGISCHHGQEGSGRRNAWGPPRAEGIIGFEITFMKVTFPQRGAPGEDSPLRINGDLVAGCWIKKQFWLIPMRSGGQPR